MGDRLQFHFRTGDRGAAVSACVCPSAHSGAINVVLIDHRRLVREALRLIVERGGAAKVIGEAENGEEGLEMILRLCPAAAVMDAEAPGRTAVCITEVLRSQGRKTGVVVIGPAGSSAWARMAHDAGVAGYVSAADDPAEVLEAVRAAAEGRAYTSCEARRQVAQRLEPWLFPEAGAGVESLSPREQEVLVQLARGLSVKQVAAILHLSVKTVDNHSQRLMAKLDIHSRAELVRLAIRERLLTA